MTEAEVAKQLILNLNQCESVVQQDVIKRCSDWFQSGGSFNDPYIESQLRFTFRHLEIERAKHKQ